MGNSFTVWLKIFLFTSIFSVGIVKGQTIDKFPYELVPNASGWELNGGTWSETGPIIVQNDDALPIFSLQSPKLQFLNGGGLLEFEACGTSSEDFIYISGMGENHEEIFHYSAVASAEMSSYSVILPNNIKYISITSYLMGKSGFKINSLRILSFGNSMTWKESDGVYSISGGSYGEGQKAEFCLPEIANAKKTVITFDVKSVTPDKYDVYFVISDANDMGILWNAEFFQAVNGKGVVVLENNGKLAPRLLAVSKGGACDELVVCNYKVRQLTMEDEYDILNFDFTHWYDINKDGKLEFTNKDNLCDVVNGMAMPYDKIELDGIKISDLYPCNVNNDNAVDYIINGKSVFTNTEGGDKLISHNDNEILYCDYNNDGLADFITRDKNESVALQLVDGSFLPHQFKTYSREEYLNRDKANEEWNPTLYNYSNVVCQNRNDAFLSNKDMFVGSSGDFEGSMGAEASSMDFNKDGVPDIVDYSSGNIMLYAAEDKYVDMPMGGAIFFRDLNNDMRTDYIVYEPTTKTVSSHVVQDDGTEKVQTLISNMSMDKKIWCRDMDGDGDVDIVLPFSYLDSNGASFLVVMENDGTGHFKMHETPFDEMLDFCSCADIDGDGHYEVLATHSVSDKVSENHEALILRCLDNLQFELEADPLVVLDPRPKDEYYEEERICKMQLADIDHDGYYELLVSYQKSVGNREYIPVHNVYNVKDLMPEAKANKAPQRPEKPTFTYEPSTGLIKISWLPGKDSESSSADLTYALRVGSEPGKGDVYYAHALADGTRLNLQEGNMGYDLDRIINVSGWHAGKYYISVQAIDPMFSGSLWSEEAVFEKTELASGFYVSDERTVADTITVSLASPVSSMLTYEWDMGGADILSRSDDGVTYTIAFSEPGEKRITLTTTDNNGNISVSDKQLYISANKLESKKLIDNYWCYGVIDLDNDGLYELLTSNGVYESDEEGNYTKLKKIYNTNLKFNDPLFVADFNKDGLPDVIDLRYVFSGVYTFFVNQGDKVLDSESRNGTGGLNLSYIKTADLNNDGVEDLIGQSYLYINSGDYLNYENVVSDGGYVTDMDKDGFLDFVISRCDEKDGKYVVSYMRNLGYGPLEITEIPITASGFSPESSFDIEIVADMNNDGYQDLVTMMNNNTILVLLNNANTAFDKVVKLSLPFDTNEEYRRMMCMDLDNNGMLDIILYENENSKNKTHIVYLYDNWEFMSSPEFAVDMSFYMMTCDLDYDSIPDFLERSSYCEEAVLNKSRVSNTRPMPPVNIRSRQDASFVTIQWDAAYDAETPYAQMRYNISVKKQGVSGEGAYIISPMNNMSNEGAVSPMRIYSSATTFSIPLTAIPAGKYEVCVQAIDGWDAASPFSETYILTVETSAQISVPTDVYAGTPVLISYIGNVKYSDLKWSWDGGELVNDLGGVYTVKWSTEGRKNISVTANGSIYTAEVLVKPAIDASYSIASHTLASSKTPVELPDGDYSFEWYVSRNGSRMIPLDEYNSTNKNAALDIVYSTGNVAYITFEADGQYGLRLYAKAPGGKAYCDRVVTVYDVLEKTDIDLITVDQATGKYKISWSGSEELPSFVKSINIYKETSVYNDFMLLASVPATQKDYTDLYSNPQVASARYCISVTCDGGIETALGTPHKGVHVMMNRGIGSSWNILWNQYEGAEISTYRVLRGTSPQNMSVVAEVAGNVTSYTDVNAPAGTLYYALAFDVASAVKSSVGNSGLRASADILSNIVCTDNATSVVLAENVYIYSTDELALYPGHANINLNADIYPLNATFKKLVWSVVEGNDIAYVDQNGALTAEGSKNGTVTVRAATVDGSGVYSDISIIVNGMTAIENVDDDNSDVVVYPSVIHDAVHVRNLTSGKNRVSIYSLSGQMMDYITTSGSELDINCTSYPAGMYFIKVEAKGNTITKKLIKK